MIYRVVVLAGRNWHKIRAGLFIHESTVPTMDDRVPKVVNVTVPISYRVPTAILPPTISTLHLHSYASFVSHQALELPFLCFVPCYAMCSFLASFLPRLLASLVGSFLPSLSSSLPAASVLHSVQKHLLHKARCAILIKA